MTFRTIFSCFHATMSGIRVVQQVSEVPPPPLHGTESFSARQDRAEKIRRENCSTKVWNAYCVMGEVASISCFTRPNCFPCLTERTGRHWEPQGDHALQLWAARAFHLRLRSGTRQEKGHRHPQGQHHVSLLRVQLNCQMLEYSSACRFPRALIYYITYFTVHRLGHSQKHWDHFQVFSSLSPVIGKNVWWLWMSPNDLSGGLQ